VPGGAGRPGRVGRCARAGERAGARVRKRARSGRLRRIGGYGRPGREASPVWFAATTPLRAFLASPKAVGARRRRCRAYAPCTSTRAGPTTGRSAGSFTTRLAGTRPRRAGGRSAAPRDVDSQAVEGGWGTAVAVHLLVGRYEAAGTRWAPSRDR